MGTNYYLHQKRDCECCGRPFDALHIGKSSSGWCFSLHIIPEEGIDTLDDWRRLWSAPGAVIKNEYGDAIAVEEMEKIITVRGRLAPWGSCDWWAPGAYRSELDFHDRNQSERGPSGLLRHRINAHCVAHGEGTWDCIIGEFS